MKLDFNDLNIEPMPNPKPLAVERVRVNVSPDGKDASNLHGQQYGFIRRRQD